MLDFRTGTLTCSLGTETSVCMTQADVPMTYEIVESSLDPNRPWQLIGRNASRTEMCRAGFKTYGDAWREAQRRQAIEGDGQADLLDWAEQQSQTFR